MALIVVLLLMVAAAVVLFGLVVSRWSSPAIFIVTPSHSSPLLFGEVLVSRLWAAVGPRHVQAIVGCWPLRDVHAAVELSHCLELIGWGRGGRA